MKCQILFSRKKNKKNISLSSAEFAHTMVSVQDTVKHFVQEYTLRQATVELSGKKGLLSCLNIRCHRTERHSINYLKLNLSLVKVTLFKH